jgi:hypothetical protein
LQRAAYDIGYKGELIGVLEAEVLALREGRSADADMLRRAREAALAPTVVADDVAAITEPPEAEPSTEPATGQKPAADAASGQKPAATPAAGQKPAATPAAEDDDRDGEPVERR